MLNPLLSKQLISSALINLIMHDCTMFLLNKQDTTIRKAWNFAVSKWNNKVDKSIEVVFILAKKMLRNCPLGAVIS